MSSQPKFPTKSITFRDRSFPLLQKRTFNSLSIETINAIKIITFDLKYPPYLVGSYQYVINEYPSDIDLNEKYESCCDFNEAVKDVKDKIQNIALKIKNEKNVYLGDFKAGYDTRYFIDIGYIKRSRLKNYNPLLIRNSIINIANQGLFTEKQKNNLLFKVIEKPTIQEYTDLENNIKKYYIVRWNIDELIKGFKILSLNVRFTLEEAIEQKSLIKVDIWLFLNQRYLELSNFLMLTYKDKNGFITLLTEKPKPFEDALIQEIFYYNSVDKYMKVAKRLWSYAVLKKDKELIINLYSLFSSGAAKMYQIVGETEVIKNILEKYKKISIKTITLNIDNWKSRLGTIMSDILPVQEAHVIFNKINDAINAVKNNKRDILIFLLDEIADKLTQCINKYVKLQFDLNNIKIDKYLLSPVKVSNKKESANKSKLSINFTPT